MTINKWEKSHVEKETTFSESKDIIVITSDKADKQSIEWQVWLRRIIGFAIITLVVVYSINTINSNWVVILIAIVLAASISFVILGLADWDDVRNVFEEIVDLAKQFVLEIID